MAVIFTVLVVSMTLELIAVFLKNGNLRKTISGLGLVLLAFSSGWLVIAKPNVLTALIAIISFYRGVNLLRLVESRVNDAYLRRTAPQTALWMISAQIVVLGLLYLFTNMPIDTKFIWNTLAYSEFIAAAAMLCLTLRHLNNTNAKWKTKKIDETDMPTVTVAIPARNEDVQLEQCLESILASNYPKLEVIVLDDCSQDHTSEIIRRFAHDGVRFVGGEEPRENWLAKNQTYDQLFKESSGDILLFCGVDVRFEVETIRTLVTTMVNKHKTMMSIAPVNKQTGFSLPQAFRYLWEFVPPRTLIHRPAVLSTCWLIHADALKALGGFKGVANMITPEAYFAKRSQAQGSYLFARSNHGLGLSSTKFFGDQFDTSVRVRYPQMHRRPEFVAVTGLAELILLVLPFSLAIFGLRRLDSQPVLELLYLLTCILLVTLYVNLGFQLFPRGRMKFLIALPAAALFDIALMQYSMWKYEFSEVVWKGRNVCIPVLQVEPKLPKLH